MLTCFDAHLRADAPPAAGVPGTHGSRGGILFGAQAPAWLPQLPEPYALSAAPLANLIGPGDPRFPAAPARGRLLIDLTLEWQPFLSWLRRAQSDWFPLLDAARSRRLWIRCPLAPNGATCNGIRRIARQTREATFIADPFRFGPDGAWPAMLRLAELPNVLITTLGMHGPQSGWNGKVTNAAMRFLAGEVGAGKLLLASGADVADPSVPAELEKWVASIDAFDDDQRMLVLNGNARERLGGEALFADDPPPRGGTSLKYRPLIDAGALAQEPAGPDADGGPVQEDAG
jgi:hypothetical protein